jgi:glycosyltransferase involved in cell wall biosynthesis
MKILCLQSHPIQYFAPLFKSISIESFCDFKVYYCTDSSIKGYNDKGFGKSVKWDIPLLEGYEYSFLKNYSPWPGTNLKFYNLINPGIIKAIINEKPNIVWIHGWSYFTIWLAILVCKITGTKIWLKCENPLNQELKKSKVILLLKKIIFQYFLFSLIDKFLYIGSQNRLFYKYYGVKDNKLVFSPYAVDNTRFSKSFLECKSKRSELRSILGIPIEKIVVLFSGKLIRKKRPLDLLEAFSKLNLTNVILIFLGDGELKYAIEENIKVKNLKNVLVTGFVNQSEIVNYYVLSDIFVLPSDIGETWGLVVNEAMNFGLPVIVSDMVGCAKDLVENGVNGYIYPARDINTLIEKLKELCLSPEKRNKFGKASLELIKEYSYDRIINEMKYCLLTAKH